MLEPWVKSGPLLTHLGWKPICIVNHMQRVGEWNENIPKEPAPTRPIYGGKNREESESGWGIHGDSSTQELTSRGCALFLAHSRQHKLGILAIKYTNHTARVRENPPLGKPILLLPSFILTPSFSLTQGKSRKLRHRKGSCGVVQWCLPLPFFWEHIHVLVW